MRTPRTEVPAAAGLTLALVLLLTGCTASGGEASGTTSSPSGAPTGSAGSTGAATSRPLASATSSTPAGPPAATASAIATATLSPVPVGAAGDFGDGLVARVVTVQPRQLTAQGPGEVAGPGVLVTLELTNGTSRPIDLDGVSVTASYGSGEQASPNTSAPAAPATGRLAPGKSATGTWAFAVPSGQQSSLVLSISSISSPNVVVVRA